VAGVFVGVIRFVDLVDPIEAVQLRQLPPRTSLLVWTRNSLYRFVVTKGSNVFVQGGRFFPRPTAAVLEGAIVSGYVLKVGWLGVGLLMEIRVGRRRIVTSAIRAIATGRPGHEILH
jgi:hypothetical protein